MAMGRRPSKKLSAGAGEHQVAKHPVSPILHKQPHLRKLVIVLKNLHFRLVGESFAPESLCCWTFCYFTCQDVELCLHILLPCFFMLL